MELCLQTANNSEIDVVPNFDYGRHFDGKVILRLQDFLSFEIFHVLVVQVHNCGGIVPSRFLFLWMVDLVYHFFEPHQFVCVFEPIAAQIEAQFQVFSQQSPVNFTEG